MIEKIYSFDHGGKTIDVYTLKNSSGMEMDVCTYGGRILRLTAPDRNGRMGDVIMGFKRPEDYVKNHAYYGAFIGRATVSEGPASLLTALHTSFIPITDAIRCTAERKALT